MSESIRIQQQYDHRLRQLIQTTGDLDLAVRYGVPRSTARGWLKQARTDVVSIDVLDMDAAALQREVLVLQRRVTRLRALLQLVVVVLKVSGFSFERIRIPEGTKKQRLLYAIERARIHVPLRGVTAQRLSPAYQWSYRSLSKTGVDGTTGRLDRGTERNGDWHRR